VRYLARMHTRRRGRSGSTRPPSTKTPQWLDLTPETVEQIAIELAREGTKPSEIGVILRDRHGVPSFRQVTGKRLVEFLSEAGTAPEMPEDLSNLLDKAHSLVEHLRRNPSDGKNRHSLEGIGSPREEVCISHPLRCRRSELWGHHATLRRQNEHGLLLQDNGRPDWAGFPGFPQNFC